MTYESHDHYMQLAYSLASQSYREGGCPIGAVLVDNVSGSVLGSGSNRLVQDGDPIAHGEMAALRAAGRMPNRHRTTMYTTLQPCFMCAGAIVQFGIPRVVVADTANAESPETVEFLGQHGVEVIVLKPAVSDVARKCIQLTKRFRDEAPQLWLEDWGGGANPMTGRERRDS